MRLPWRRKEQRTIDSVPWDYGGPEGHARVDETRALALTPVYAAQRHIAGTLSTLPLRTYAKQGDRRVTRPQAPLLADLEENGALIPWLYAGVQSLAARGNAVGLVTRRDGLGWPQALTWLPMSQVHVDDSSWPFPVWYWKGRWIAAEDIVHIPWFVVPGRTLGLSPLEVHQLTVTGGLSAAEYGKEWFDAGGFPPGTFRNTAQTVDQKEATVIKRRVVQAVRSREPLVYGKDWEYTPITVPPEQAQFVETAKLTASQIAAIYGIAPEECGGDPAGSLTYTNEESRQRNRLSNLREWMVRFEHKLSSLLPGDDFVRFNQDAVVRADIKTRWEVHKIRREIGASNIDEIRALEDEEPLPDGKGQDYTPLGARSVPQENRTNGNGHHKADQLELGAFNV